MLQLYMGNSKNFRALHTAQPLLGPVGAALRFNPATIQQRRGKATHKYNMVSLDRHCDDAQHSIVGSALQRKRDTCRSAWLGPFAVGRGKKRDTCRSAWPGRIICSFSKTFNPAAGRRRSFYRAAWQWKNF